MTRRRSPFMEVPMGEHIIEALDHINKDKLSLALMKLGPRWVLARTRNLSRVCCPTTEFKVHECWVEARAVAGLTAP